METVEENSPVEMLEENSPAEVLEENSAEMPEGNSAETPEGNSVDMLEENSPTDMSILIQFAKFSRGYRISDFDEFVTNTIGLGNFDFLGRLAYPNQWQIRLTDKELRESLILSGKTVINNRCCWMYPLNQREIRGFVHWLPNSVTNDQLRDLLQLYGEVLFVETQGRTFKGHRVENDRRYYGLILAPGAVKEDLPHFLKINDYKCLLVVRGRQPACFHCREVGHRRAHCQKYKEKLISLSQRPPNTASQRMIPRERRHVQVVTKVEDISEGNEVSSSDDIVSLERQTPTDEATTDSPLSVSEDPKGITEEHEGIRNIGQEFVDKDGLAVKKTKNYFDFAVPISAKGNQRQGFLKVMKQSQRKATENVKQMLTDFAREFCTMLTKKELSSDTSFQRENVVCKNLEEMYRKELEKQSTVYVSEETATPVELAVEDSTAILKETENLEMRSVSQTMHEAKGQAAETIEKIDKKPEEMGKEIQSTESNLNAAFQMKRIAEAGLMLDETKEDVLKLLRGSVTRMKEFLESRRATAKSSKASAADSDPNCRMSQDDLQSSLGMAERAKQLGPDGPEKALDLEKRHANLSLQLSENVIFIDAKLTENDTYLAKQMLEKTEKSLAEIFHSNFRNLKESIKVTDSTPTTTSYVTTISEQLKQDIVETAPPVSKTEIEVDVGTGFDKSSEKTIETQSEFENIVESKEIEVFDPSKEKMLTTEKAFSDKGMEWDVSRAVQEDRDELQTALKKIFALIRDEKELLPETRDILKKVELQVIEVFDATKSRLKTKSK